MKHILVSLPLDDASRRWLEARVADLPEEYAFRYCPVNAATPEDATEADVILGYVPTAALRAAKHLEWYQLSWAGADAVLAEGLPERVVLTNAAGAYGLAVGEHMVATTLALVKRLHQYARLQAAHDWRLLDMVRTVEGATVLVLGVGDIGSCYAKKMKALGASVIGVKRTPGPKPEWLDELHQLDALDALLPRADIVAMALPGGQATANLMDARRFARMKPGAFLVNAGRGNSVELEALKSALAAGRLGGAALDVFDPEPLPAEDSLWDDPRVIVTPHCSGKFLLQETIDRVVKLCGDNLRRYAHGEPLLHVVGRRLGY